MAGQADENMFYYVYVLACYKDNKLSENYIGYCQDLKRRFEKHTKKQVKTTKKFDKVSLIYYEACLNRKDARKREIQLKTGFGRGYIKRRLDNYFQNLIE